MIYNVFIDFDSYISNQFIQCSPFSWQQVAICFYDAVSLNKDKDHLISSDISLV